MMSLLKPGNIYQTSLAPFNCHVQLDANNLNLEEKNLHKVGMI